MDQTLNVAKEAAKSGRHDEVASILKNATMTLRRATQSESSLSSKGAGSFLSSKYSREPSAETLPTVYTKPSAQRLSQPLPFEHQSNEQKRSKHDDDSSRSPGDDSISPTPPRLYQQASADSIIRDFAYNKAKNNAPVHLPRGQQDFGSAADYYGDHGESVAFQPGVRKSIARPPTDKDLPEPRKGVEHRPLTRQQSPRPHRTRRRPRGGP